MNIDFDDAWVRCHFQLFEPSVRRRQIAFHHDRHFQFGCGVFDGGNEINVIFQSFDRWHEDMQAPASGFDTERGANNPRGRLAGPGCLSCFRFKPPGRFLLPDPLGRAAKR